MASELRRSLSHDEQVNRDIDALLRRLQDATFATRLLQSLRSNDAARARELVQSTARTTVEVEIASAHNVSAQ